MKVLYYPHGPKNPPPHKTAAGVIKKVKDSKKAVIDPPPNKAALEEGGRYVDIMNSESLKLESNIHFRFVYIRWGRDKDEWEEEEEEEEEGEGLRQHIDRCFTRSLARSLSSLPPPPPSTPVVPIFPSVLQICLQFQSGRSNLPLLRLRQNLQPPIPYRDGFRANEQTGQEDRGF